MLREQHVQQHTVLHCLMLREGQMSRLDSDCFVFVFLIAGIMKLLFGLQSSRHVTNPVLTTGISSHLHEANVIDDLMNDV